MPEIKEIEVHDVYRACNKIRAALSRIHLNIWNCFDSLDPEKKHLISESSFINVLSGPFGKLVGLSNQEICEITDYFRTQDGRVYYAQFCSIIEENNPKFEKNVSYITGQEWEDPLQTNCLSASEERRIKLIITKIASTVHKRKLILEPYFQDHELIVKNCGAVSFAHFSRILHFLNIVVAPEEVHLLIKKFAKDNYTVNYIPFVKAIEQAQDFLECHSSIDKGHLLNHFPGRIITAKLPKLARPEIGKIKSACVFPQQLHFLSMDTSSKRIRGVKELILRIQDHVIKNHLIVSHYFKDFDVMNVGKISPHQFERGLNRLSRSALGTLYIAPEELEILKAFYTDSNENDRILWRTFEDDVDQGSTIKHLDKHPNCKVLPSEDLKNLPRKGHQEWECAEFFDKAEIKKLYKKTFEKIMFCTKEKRFRLRSYFRDFDKHSRGHISRDHLCRALAVAAIPLTKEEILSLEFMHSNDSGFHYMDFIKKLEDSIGDSPFCKSELNDKPNTSEPSKKYQLEEKDIDIILTKIKDKIVRNGIKVNEFIRKFDKRNIGLVTMAEFERGIDNLKCDLTCTEIDTIKKHFSACNRPGYVNYLNFVNKAESARATPFMEKSPRLHPIQHVPFESTPRSFLNFDERQILMRTLDVLSSHVLDSNLEEIFKDLDKIGNGTVTRSQLIRAFSVRNIIYHINKNELDILCKCFAVGHVTLPQMFDYHSFLNALYILRKNKTYNPF